MKKYLKLLPLILYPYAYLIWFMLLIEFSDMIDNFETKVNDVFNGAEIDFFGILFIAYNVYVVFIVIYNAVKTSGNKYTAYEVAKMNMVVKGWQIPAYIFHFLMGLVGMLMSVWGIAFIMIALIVDVLAIAFSGVNAIGCAIKLAREKIIHPAVAVLMAIGSFVFCVDVIIAVVYVVLGKRNEVKKQLNKNEMIHEVL